MNNTQKNLSKLLSNSIRGIKNIDIDYSNLDLKELFDEANSHNVTSLIYNSLNKKSLNNNTYENLLKDVKLNTIFSILRQSEHVNRVSKVLLEFNNHNIPVIVLKGLVVRYLYPEPNLRTMCDADVLVHPEDLDKVTSLLKSLGFKLIEDSHEHGAHIVFFNGSTVIEVHWRLTNKDYYKGDISFEDSLWENAMKVDVEGVETLSLGYEDLALHLCVHMAVHLACHGFGIRQLCDLVLLVEKKGDLINWNEFLERARMSNIEKFSLAIFKVCNILFDMKIPKELSDAEKISNKYINLFIDDIFENGVGGRKDESKIFANELAFEVDESKNTKFNIIKKFFVLLFPPISKMNDKYNYAKKYKFLAPIAWIHHLFEGVRNDDYSFKNKFKILTSTISNANKRNKLMNWLEI